MMPVEIYDQSRSSISALFLLCAPPDIFGFIIAIGVFAIQTMTLTWPIAYVLTKTLKALPPSIAYGYSSPTIQVEVGGARRVTSGNHSLPYLVERMASLRSSVLGFVSASNLRLQTAATFSVSAFKCVARNLMQFSAGALTQPDSMASFRVFSNYSNSGQPSECFA